MNLFGTKGKRMRETWLILSAMFLLSVLAGCAGRALPQGQEAGGPDGRLRIVTTLFPYYDFTRRIAGDAVDLSMVIPAGMDSHSFEPTPADIRLIREADLLICNGGTMEQWVERVLGSVEAPDLTVVTMTDHVAVVEEELIEGMEDADEDHAQEDADGDDGRDLHDGHDYDEHIWTSPVNAIKITQVIAEALGEADPENREYYAEAAGAYQKELAALDNRFRKIVAEADSDLIVMGDRFPLRYFADEYGLRYRAAFSGCATDTEPSAKTIAYLIDCVREEDLKAVYYLELSSSRVAEIIGEETGAKPLLFHSCHNVTRREFEEGVTYLELMEKNADNLEIGLN